MKIHLLICAVVLSANKVYGDGSECKTPEGGAGICQHITLCQDLMDRVNAYAKGNSSDSDIEVDIQRRKCGDKNSWTVCCTNCVTPDGKGGVRKRISECPHLMKMIQQGNISDLDYLKRSRVDATNDICCGPAPATHKRPARASCDDLIATPPHPATGCCGVDASADTKIQRGYITSIEEYPWAVLLEYETVDDKPFLCGGTLISNRHVVTAAHCLINDQNIRPISVRVGEYDTTNCGEDCVILPDGAKDCTDGAQSIPIESILVHHHGYDIALIKLKEPVKYTAFVRPICLPSSRILEKEDLIVTGWGLLSTNSSTISRFKQAAHVTSLEMRELSKANRARCQISLCAKPGSGPCLGDSGGPLMRVNPEQYFHELAGVVSTGHPTCGEPGYVTVYVRVHAYLDWIRANL